jgi:hypothetical protein
MSLTTLLIGFIKTEEESHQFRIDPFLQSIQGGEKAEVGEGRPFWNILHCWSLDIA